MADIDWDRIERTAEALRNHRRPVLAYDADSPPYADPPSWVDDPPPVGDAKQARKIEVLDLAALKASAENVSWLVKHVVPADSLGILFGASDTFKSFVCVDLACHVAHGVKWMGRKTKKGSVLYIAAEGGAGLWRRVDAWHRHHQLLWDQCDLRVISAALDLGETAADVVLAVQERGFEPALIVVDTMSQTFSGEENSAKEVATYLRELGLWLRETWRCTVLIVHHTGHVATERPRGSSSIRSNVDFMLGCHREEKEMVAVLSCLKQKDGEKFKDAMFAMTVCDLERDEDDDLVTALVAHAVLSDDEKASIVATEAARGRSGRNALLLNLAQNGMRADDLRRAFYDQVDAQDTDARRQAYFRALGWAKRAALVEIVDGYVLLSKAAMRDK